jgi:glycerol kinase
MLADSAVRRRAEQGELAAGTVDSWLVARLTAGASHVTDHTNASRTMLYGLEARGWDPELLTLFSVPPALLPTIVPSGGVSGECRPEHFGHAMPIAGIAGDQQAALFGQGCVTAGSAKNTYGTGTFLLMHAGERRPRSAHGLLTTAACGPRGEPAYALEGSVFIAGAAVQWLRDGLGLLARADESEALARGVPDTGGVHFVPAFVGLGSPHWEAEARGTVTGLTRGTTRAHLVRAALEAMAFSSAALVETMRTDAGLEPGALRVDGGASANSWLMQFLADVLGAPVERPDMIETTALGAAGLAGITLGVWRDTAQFLEGMEFTVFRPASSAAERASRRAGWDRAVHAALAWARYEV